MSFEERVSDPEPVADNAAPDTSPSGFGKLGKKIAGRTTDLVAIAIILIAGVTMGRSVLEWWNTDPADILAHNPQAIVDRILPPDWESGIPVNIDMGDSPVRIERWQLAGQHQEVKPAFVEKVLARTLSAEMPSALPDENEQRLRSSLSLRKPEIVAPDGSAVYFSDGPVNLYVGMKTRLQPASGKDKKEPDVRETRIVCWGLAFPSGDAAWIGYLFLPQPGTANGSKTDWRDVLPAGSICSLSLSSREGYVLLAFDSSTSIQKTQTELEQNLAARNFIPSEDWQQTPAGKQRVFRDQQDSERLAIVQLKTTAAGRISGLIHISAEHPEKATL